MKLVCVGQFLGEMHKLENQHAVFRFHSGEVLPGFNHDLGNSHFAGFRQRLAQQNIRFVSAFLRLQIVGFVEKHWIDFFLIDEILNIDRLSRLEIHPLKIFVFQDDVITLFVLVAFDDLVPRHFFTVFFRHPLVIDRTQIFRAQKPKFEFFFAGRGIKSDRNVNQPKTDTAFPDCSHT